MSNALSYVITISHQIGSGGAYLGQRIAFRLCVQYVDHEIIRQAAQDLKIPEEHLAFRDEKVTSRWQSLIQANPISFDWYPPQFYILKDQELYNAESDIISRIANECTAVIVGRGGYYVLRHHPRCLNVFLHANINFRQKRVQEIYHISSEQSLNMIRLMERDRANYLRKLTGQNWLDARQYHICLDTSAIGLDKAEDIILETLEARFKDVEIVNPS